MCGIVGLFLKDKSLEPKLGELTAGMLGTMCDRGPDSAGFAIYATPEPGRAKITVQSSAPESEFPRLSSSVAKAIGADVPLEVKSTHAVLSVPADKADAARTAIRADHPAIRIMG